MLGTRTSDQEASGATGLVRLQLYLSHRVVSSYHGMKLQVKPGTYLCHMIFTTLYDSSDYKSLLIKVFGLKCIDLLDCTVVRTPHCLVSSTADGGPIMQAS